MDRGGTPYQLLMWRTFSKPGLVTVAAKETLILSRRGSGGVCSHFPPEQRVRAGLGLDVHIRTKIRREMSYISRFVHRIVDRMFSSSRVRGLLPQQWLTRSYARANYLDLSSCIRSPPTILRI
jgi:hypothetical protein